MTRDRNVLRKAGNRGAVANAARALASLRDADHVADDLAARLSGGASDDAAGEVWAPAGDLPLVAPGHTGAPGEHLLALYEEDAALVRSVSGQLVPAWHAGGSVLVVATRTHRAQLLASFRAAGVDPAAPGPQRLWLLDAESVLRRFMVAGAPDRSRFRSVVGELLTAAGAGGRHVHVYGEMVALLWERGDVQAAIELERLWNELARSVEFSLCCGYPLRVLRLRRAGGSISAMCAEHGALVTSGPGATAG